MPLLEAAPRRCRPRRSCQTAVTSITSTRCASADRDGVAGAPAGAKACRPVSTIRFRCTSRRRTRSRLHGGRLPRIAKRRRGEVLSLPIFPEMTSVQVEQVASTLRREANVG